MSETIDRTDEWARLRERNLAAAEDRPATTGRGVHHVALLCTDVQRTIDFYQGILGFPLTELFENRDFTGSTHFFFDIGNSNALAFFDFPGLDLGDYAEVLMPSAAEEHTMRAWGSRYARLVLERSRGNKREACRKLGISYHTLNAYLAYRPGQRRVPGRRRAVPAPREEARDVARDS